MRGFFRSGILGGLLLIGIGLLPMVTYGLSNEAKSVDPVNSEYSDFAPIVSPDGNYLFFASDREGGYGGQDIWFSKREKGEWSKPTNLGPPINDNRNQGPDCFVEEGGTWFLYLTYCNPSTAGLCDIYVSTKPAKATAWSVPEKLPEPINTRYSDANASWDYINNVLYFVSTRPGGMPGPGPKRIAGESSYDIWMCKRKKDKSWEEPKNLGAPVNTPGWEGVAFFNSADQKLYFSSNGHADAGGEGGADIFVTQLVGGKWSEPKPVPEVNTPDNDMYFSTDAAANLAYFSTTHGTAVGKEDIWLVPWLVKPVVAVVKETTQLPTGEKKQIGPSAGHIETIYFDFDRSDIRPDEAPKLDRVVEFMNENPKIRIEVAGHACSVGKTDYNLVLSKNRAESVKKYLVNKGISPDRIVVTYYGEERPAEPNDPSKGNPLNRRVEISILE